MSKALVVVSNVGRIHPANALLIAMDLLDQSCEYWLHCDEAILYQELAYLKSLRDTFKAKYSDRWDTDDLSPEDLSIVEREFDLSSIALWRNEHQS